MPTTGTVKGNLVGIYIETAQDVYDLIACATNASLSIQNEMIETVCKDNDGQRTVLPGQQTVTMTVEGLTAYDNVGRTELYNSVRLKTQLVIQYGTGVSGDPYTQCTAYISSFEETAPLNDSTSFSVTFECTNHNVGTYA